MTEKIMLQDSDVKQVWARPCQLMKIYGVGRTTLYNWLKGFQASKKYRGKFIDLSQCVKLVNVKAFEEYLQGLHQMYLKK